MKKKSLLKRGGFTLIELVIVIAILALLIAIALPRYQKSNLSAQATAHNANVRMIKNAAVLYSMDHENVTTISMNDLAEYLENKEIPKPAKSLDGYTAFQVEYKEGDVIVTPGNVKVQGDKLVLENTSN